MVRHYWRQLFLAVQNSSIGDLVTQSLHYRLRCPLGFWDEQKVVKSRCLFLSKKNTPKLLQMFFDQNMTQILYQKNFNMLVRSCFFMTLIKCLKCHRSLGSLIVCQSVKYCESVTEWQGHLLSCSGQLKIGKGGGCLLVIVKVWSW